MSSRCQSLGRGGKEQFCKRITQTGCIFSAKVHFQRRLGDHQKGFPFESRDLSYRFAGDSIQSSRQKKNGLWAMRCLKC